MKHDKIDFEWDATKNKINIKKHGVSFEYAARVWDDKKRLIKADTEHSEYEERWQTIGLVDKLIFVVYVEKTEKNVRIISARRASREERNEYYCDYEFR